jgi:hypothetical protein
VIDAIAPAKNAATAATAQLDAETPPQRSEPKPAAPGATEVQTAEQQQEVTASSPSFDVRLDSRTLKLYSELRDPATDRVLLRIPADYQPKEEGAQAAPRLDSHYAWAGAPADRTVGRRAACGLAVARGRNTRERGVISWTCWFPRSASRTDWPGGRC